MGTGYTRNDTGNNISNGSVIDANDLDGEFNAIESAFNSSTGHTHDGTNAEGAPIAVTGPSQEYVSGNLAFYPKTDDTYDLGTATFKWKDLYVDGVAAVDTLSVNVDATFVSISDLGEVATADINGGTIDGTVVGGTVAAAGSFTTLTTTSTSSFGDNLSVSGNITITGTVDGRDVAADGSKLDTVESGATADQTGAEIKSLYELEADTNAFTDSLKTKLEGIEAAATADQTGSEIKTLYEAELNTNAFTDAEKSKLSGIESGATADQTGAEIKSLYELEADTNAFTDAEKSKLSGIESGATADQTGGEIKSLYESEVNTNAYTDAEKSKLSGIEAGATADQTGSEIKALYEAEADTNAFTDSEKGQLSGTTPFTNIDVNGGAIDGTSIGATSASTGAFTTLSSTGNATFGGATATITGNATVGGTLGVTGITTLTGGLLDDTQVVNSSGTQTGLIGDQATATWEAGTATTESLVSPAKVKAAVEALVPGGIGVGQTWQDVLSSRSTGVSYQNTTGKPIMVVMQGVNGGAIGSPEVSATGSFSGEEVPIGTINGGDSTGTSFIVPDTHYYRVPSAVTKPATWAELR